MAFKIENSNIFVKIYNDLKINIQVLIDLHNRPCMFQLNQTSSFQVANI